MKVLSGTVRVGIYGVDSAAWVKSDCYPNSSYWDNADWVEIEYRTEVGEGYAGENIEIHITQSGAGTAQFYIDYIEVAIFSEKPTGQVLLIPRERRQETTGNSGLYDFSVDGGAQGSITLGRIPDNASITLAKYEILSAFTSDGAATVAFGVKTNDATGIKGATAFNHGDYAVGFHDAVPDGTATNFTAKTTAERKIIMTIATADLTAGKVRVWWDYIIGD